MRKDNKTGVTGVTPKNGKYRAQLNRGGKNYDLGIFDTVSEAAEARKEGERRFNAGLPPRGPSTRKNKTYSIHVAMDSNTIADLAWCAEKLGCTKSDVIRLGIAKVKEDINKNTGD